MITRLTILFYVLINSFCYSQADYSNDWVNSGYRTENDSTIDVTKQVINKTDLSYLLKSTYPGYNKEIAEVSLYGLLGEDFNKIEFVFTNIVQSDKNASKYVVKGKTRLNDTIKTIKGYIKFDKAIAYLSEYEEDQTIVALTASYKFEEVENNKTSATYIGKLKMILSTENVHSDTIFFNMDMSSEDGAVRGFVGVRTNYKTNVTESCIWGFLRFPYQYANRFDLGAGEEIINLKYAKPWFNYSETEWDNIINGKDKAIYLHTDQEAKGISTSYEAYIKPEEATWHKLTSTELEKNVIEQLKIKENRLYFTTTKQFSNRINEAIVVIAEIVNENYNEETDQTYKLTCHILIVNSVTGKIKHQYSDKGWQSDALILSDISINTTTYNLTEDQVAFGIIVSHRNSSQPNPNSYSSISLYIKDNEALKKVLNNLIVDEYTGIINVNMNSCYADIKREKQELTILESETNGYYDIQVKNTIVKSIFEIDTNGECEPVEKSRVEKVITLKYNDSKYIIEL